MATPVKKWLLRVAPWFLPVGIVAVWQLALLSWLAVDAYFALTGRGGDGVLDALRQRRTVAASGDQFLAGADWLFNWRIAGVDFGLIRRAISLGRTAAGYLNSDVAQRTASGADPAGDFVVWH
ncbi:putative aliphatic sulfonates ABC transporter permease [Escherichia coli]|nr:putative aliphatic sulfonates ABC transporter permease [Escherichia coli]